MFQIVDQDILQIIIPKNAYLAILLVRLVKDRNKINALLARIIFI